MSVFIYLTLLYAYCIWDWTYIFTHRTPVLCLCKACWLEVRLLSVGWQQRDQYRRWRGIGIQFCLYKCQQVTDKLILQLFWGKVFVLMYSLRKGLCSWALLTPEASPCVILRNTEHDINFFFGCECVGRALHVEELSSLVTFLINFLA